MRGLPSFTAEIVCLMRASDQWRKRSERVLDDPYAPLFLSPALRALFSVWPHASPLMPTAVHEMTNFVLMRHRFIDEALVEALAEAAIEQLVVLGAGYDTRAYRLAEALDHRPVFEVDFPTTGRRKATLIGENAGRLPPAKVHAVAIDFQTEALDERLVAAGFRTGARTFFVWEGVSMYLTRQAVKATLRTIKHSSAGGSLLAMDYWSLPDAPDLRSTSRRLGASLMTIIGEPVTFSMHPEDVEGFVGRLGFDLADMAGAAELRRRYAKGDAAVMQENFVTLLRSRDGSS